MTTDKRIEVEFFVSYAHADDEYADPFLDDFKEMLAPSKKYRFEFWRDTVILPGETWVKEIRKALERCSLGLLLVSPAFLASPFITEKELSKFVGESSKPFIPVMLRKVNLKLHDLKGLRETQLFRLKAGPNNYRSYAQCGSSQKSDFVYSLHEQVEARLDKLSNEITPTHHVKRRKLRITRPTETYVSSEYVEVSGINAKPGAAIIVITSLYGKHLAPQKGHAIADNLGNWKYDRCHLFNINKDRIVYAIAVDTVYEQRVRGLIANHRKPPRDNAMDFFQQILKNEQIPFEISPGKRLVRR